MSLHSLYIHIPFCRSKCHYCSFISFQGKETDIPAYVFSLKKELYARLKTDTLSTIFFGGGTPSLLSVEQVGELMDTIRSLCTIAPAAEITIEANPGTITREYLSSLMKIGINRISIGVQSFNDRELALLGRIHTSREIKEAVSSAKQAGFTNINLDLIYGIPGQTLLDWQNSLEQAIALNIDHISLYALTLDSNVPMAQRIERGELPALDSDAAADHYELAEELLGSQGYTHYEISNWAKPGFECRHNLVYWNMRPYLGTGVAAHSYIDSHRTANTSSIDDYISLIAQKKSVIVMNEEIPPSLQVAEAIIVGLRLIDGISPEAVNARYAVNIRERYRPEIQALLDLELIEFTGGMMRLTRRGRLLGNEVFHRFLPDTPLI